MGSKSWLSLGVTLISKLVVSKKLAMISPSEKKMPKTAIKAATARVSVTPVNSNRPFLRLRLVNAWRRVMVMGRAPMIRATIPRP